MKRTELKRKTPLKAKQGLSRAQRAPAGRSKGKTANRASKPSRALERLRARRREPGYAAWHETRTGRCAVCRREGLLFRHHVLLEQIVRGASGRPWDLSNALDVGQRCGCHRKHHDGGDGRISFRLVPPAAIAFAVETIGAGPALNYFQRRYRDAPDQLPKGAGCQ